MVYKIVFITYLLTYVQTTYSAAAVEQDYDLTSHIPFILTTPARQRHAKFIEYISSQPDLGQEIAHISTDEFDKAVYRCEIVYKILQVEVLYKNCMQGHVEREEPDVASLPENHLYKKALLCALGTAYQQALLLRNHMPDLCVPAYLSQELPEKTSVLLEGDNGFIARKNAALPALNLAIRNAEDQLGGEDALNSPRYHMLKEILKLSNAYALSDETPVEAPCSHVDSVEDSFRRDMVHVRHDTAEKMLGYLTTKFTRDVQ